MNKVRIVAKFEIVRQLKKPSFWVMLLILPLLVLASLGLSTLNSMNIESSLSSDVDYSGNIIGITNNSGVFNDLESNFKSYIDSIETDENTEIVKIKDKESGIEKIKSGEIGIYYYLPENFLETLKIELYQNEEKTSLNLFRNYGSILSNFLKINALSKLSPEDTIAITDAIQYDTTILDMDGEKKNPLGEAIIPLAILGIFYLLVCLFGQRLVTSLAEEKENRISEMILTTVSAKTLVIGKVISLIVLGFIQIAVFIIPLLIILCFYRDNGFVAMILSSIELNPWLLISNIILLLVSYFFYAGSCTLLSSMMPTARDANNYFGIIMIGTILPLLFMSNFFSEPNLVVYILSYFPLSAPISLMLRNAFGTLPTLELVLGTIELLICSIAVLMMTVKSFQKNAINFSAVKLFGKRR